MYAQVTLETVEVLLALKEGEAPPEGPQALEALAQDIAKAATGEPFTGSMLDGCYFDVNLVDLYTFWADFDVHL